MLIFGLKVALVGFSVVFITLVLLMMIIMLQSNLFMTLAKKKEKNKIAPDMVNPEVLNLIPSESIVNTEVENDEELIAVITAAMAAYGGSQSIVVKNIRRLDQNKNWVDAGRSALMAKRQL